MMSDVLSPGHIEEAIELVTSHGSGWILMFVFASAVIENFFPPYPSDVVIFAAGFVSGSGRLSLPLLLVVAIGGSLLSTMVVHGIGRKYGRAVFERRTLRFFHPDRLPTIEAWFGRYGDSVLLVSRFVPGLRSLIALSAGIGGVKTSRMLLLSLVSVTAWTSVVVFPAFFLWGELGRLNEMMESYRKTGLILVLLVALAFIAYRLYKRKRAK